MNEETLQEQQLIEYFLLITRTKLHQSLAWMVLKSSRDFSHEDHSELIKQQGFEKEIAASQTLWSEEQIFSYSELFSSKASIGLPSDEYTEYAFRFIDVFYRRVQQLRTIIPQYNKRKNVGYHTKNIYETFAGPVDYLTTFDLERFYAATGYRTPGPCELRSAWKLNDLKNRIYYAQGGEAYFASRFIKPIAVALMESISSSSMRHRKDPDMFLSHYDQNSLILVNWDLSSFTTKLSEAKFYLETIAALWEEKIGDHVMLPVLDTFEEAVVMLSIPEMLREYNKTVNDHPIFSVHRLQDYLDEDDSLYRYQINNGMLGVPGNIGVACSLHAIIASKIAGHNHTVAIGDDAIALIPPDVEEDLLFNIESLGELSLEKVGRLPEREAEEVQVTRFLKRRLSRTDDGLKLSGLFVLPPIPFVDGKMPPGRTRPHNFTIIDRAMLVASQIGRILWDLRAYDVEFFDYKGLMSIFKAYYKAFEFPQRGAAPFRCRIPASKMDNPQKDYYPFWIPPIDDDLYDPTTTDWIDVIVQQSASEIIRIPLLSDGGIPQYRYEEGESFLSVSSRYLGFLEDWGYVKKETVYEEFYGVDLPLSKVKDFLRRNKAVSNRYTVVSSFPQWARDILRGGVMYEILGDTEF